LAPWLIQFKDKQTEKPVQEQIDDSASDTISASGSIPSDQKQILKDEYKQAEDGLLCVFH
jgi:hypothetical protein